MYAVAHEFAGTIPQRATVLSVHATRDEAEAEIETRNEALGELPPNVTGDGRVAWLVTVAANALPGDRIVADGWSFSVEACKCCRARRTV